MSKKNDVDPKYEPGILCLSIIVTACLLIAAMFESSFLFGLTIIGGIIGVPVVMHLADKKEKEAQAYRRYQAEKEPVKLIYDPSKAKPWCVQEWNGIRYVQVSGWFAKEENARKVYRQIMDRMSRYE